MEDITYSIFEVEEHARRRRVLYSWFIYRPESVSDSAKLPRVNSRVLR